MMLAGAALLLLAANGASASATASVRACAAGLGCVDAPVTVTARAPAPAALFDDYSPVSSPHWSHIRTMVTDFYYNWTPTERAWAAAHYDAEMSGDASAWLAINPAVQTYPYTLLWTTLIPSATATPNITGTITEDMRAWYALHPQYSMETAFLHDTGGVPADSAHRYTLPIWDSRRWFLNPADSGFMAYSVDRYRRIVAGSPAGAFIDESGTGDMAKATPSREYLLAAGWPPVSPYFAAYAALVARIRAAIAPKRLMLNTAGYMFPGDSADARAAGAVHLEKVNNPLSSNVGSSFAWIDRLLAAGVFVDFVDAYDYADDSVLVTRGTYPGGNEPTTFAREKMAELASYYLVVPADPSRLALQLVNMWDRPFSSVWLKAQEADIGHPTTARAIETLATKDAAGQSVVLYRRDFTRALVLFRTQTGWGTQSYADSTAVTIPLPAGETWLPLHADGSLGSAVTSVPLRNAEAAILIKGSAIP